VKRGKVWLTTGLLLFASMALSLGVAEAAIRLLLPQPTGITHQDRFGLPLHYPGITRSLPLYGTEVSFNRAGMRDREHSEKKPDGVYRILLLGDSFMEALQVQFESSLPYLLEQALSKEPSRRVEVLNAGVSGWGTDDELRYLTQYGLKYEPDLVLVAMTLHNDISDNLRESWHTVERGGLVEKSVKPMSDWNYRKTRLKAFIATRFQLYQLWRKVRHRGEIRRVGSALNTHVTDLFKEPTPVEIAKGYELTEQLLGAVRDRAGEAGAKVVLVLLPIRYQLADSAFTEFVRRAAVPATEMDPTKPQRVVTEMAGRLGLPVIDLLPRFRDWTAKSSLPLYLEWDGHWNPAGHRVATEVVVEGISQMGATQ
jgi:hypothetical protein